MNIQLPTKVLRFVVFVVGFRLFYLMKRSCTYLVMLLFAVLFSLVDISEFCVKESSKEEEEKGTAGFFYGVISFQGELCILNNAYGDWLKG